MPTPKIHVFECDGCNRTIKSTWEGIDQRRCECPHFWGWMQVGGPAWQEYYDEGKHPMSDIVGAVKRKMS